MSALFISAACSRAPAGLEGAPTGGGRPFHRCGQDGSLSHRGRTRFSAAVTPILMMETTSAPPALAPRLLVQREGILFSAESGEPAPPWVQEHYRDFHEFVASESRPHPCGFGVAAEKRRKLRSSFVDREEISRPLDLARTLLAFQALAPTLGGRPALIVFVDVPATLDAAEQEATFWSLVQSLHDLDEAPWPDTIPADLDDPLWQFCFAGEPWFINGHGTTYQKRLSRSSRRGLFLVLQTHA